MNRFSLKITIAIGAFFIGCLAVWFYFSQHSNSVANPLENLQIPEVAESKDFIKNDNIVEEETPAPINPLDEIWLDQNESNYNGYRVTKKCRDKENEKFIDDNCKLLITKGARVLDKFTAPFEYYFDYGLFNFLGGKDKQLVIHTYSGGAHCCDDYAIYDLTPTFRKIYDSTKFDSGSQIGNYLFPIDIDKDGIYEFREDVMAFDYFYESHSGSVFPPAIFSYDKGKGKYVLSNKKFSDYILDLIDNEWYVKSSNWKNENEEHFMIRKFFYLIYGGKREAAWKYYDEFLYLDTATYTNKDFKETYRKEVKKLFAEDPTYLSIYKRN